LKNSLSDNPATEPLRYELPFQPPLDWETLLAYLQARALRGVESVEDRRYLRTFSARQTGWLAVSPSDSVLRVELSASLATVAPALLARIERVFDLATEPKQIATQLGALAAKNPGLRVPGAFDGFEIAVRAILGQQVSVKSATTLAGRFIAAFGEPVETPFPTLTHLTPQARRAAQSNVNEIASLGIIATRAKSILALAEAVASDKINLEPGSDVAQTMAQLKELPGIGEWTAQYIAMRALKWPDAFPHTDLGVYKALGETRPKRVLEIAEAWRPWRAYAVFHLWKSLEEK
jgi:AraC family transcriptional regulator, regulatory protein of adaptative response / DNA-3-methyladenine glycosylase II